jgi:hypothetical protein
MSSSDTVISLVIGLGGLFITVVATWIGYLGLRAMRSNQNICMKTEYCLGTFIDIFQPDILQNFLPANPSTWISQWIIPSCLQRHISLGRKRLGYWATLAIGPIPGVEERKKDACWRMEIEKGRHLSSMGRVSESWMEKTFPFNEVWITCWI